jgi:ribosomal protein L10
MPVSDKKREFGKRLLSLLTSSRAVLIVSADNVGSKQIQDVRRGLRGDATMLMGKNVSLAQRQSLAGFDAGPCRRRSAVSSVTTS